MLQHSLLDAVGRVGQDGFSLRAGSRVCHSSLRRLPVPQCATVKEESRLDPKTNYNGEKLMSMSVESTGEASIPKRIDVIETLQQQRDVIASTDFETTHPVTDVNGRLSNLLRQYTRT